jgi:hypothetical protein
MNETQPATVTGSGILEVTCWRQENSMTVHMLNCTNPYTLRAAFRENISLGPQQVVVQIPAGRRAGDVRLLVAGTKSEVRRSANTITLTVPSITDHEVIAIELV